MSEAQLDAISKLALTLVATEIERDALRIERDTLRAENARLRGELSDWRAVAKHIYAKADDELRVTVWAMAMLNEFASGGNSPTEFDSTMTGGAYLASSPKGQE